MSPAEKLSALSKEFEEVREFAIAELRHVYDQLHFPISEKKFQSLTRDIAQSIHTLQQSSVSSFLSMLETEEFK